MRHINRNQWVAIFVGTATLFFVFYGPNFMDIFANNRVEDKSAPDHSGVEVRDITAGSGAAAARGDALTVHYTGRLENGTVFDSSYRSNTPFTFQLGVGQVIKGWDEGLLGMRVGGKRQLTISPEFGYGSAAIGGIPPHSTLIFDVELLKIERPQ